MKRLRIMIWRWLLLPLTLVLGLAIGSFATLVWAQRRLTFEEPMHACYQADALARLQRGDVAAARGLLRSDLEATLQGTAVNSVIWHVDLTSKSRELRNIATYLACDKSVVLTPEAAKLMAGFEPYSQAELEQGQCRSGICTLARSGQSASQPSSQQRSSTGPAARK